MITALLTTRATIAQGNDVAAHLRKKGFTVSLHSVASSQCVVWLNYNRAHELPLAARAVKEFDER
jgi:hypothetical protein